MENYCYSLFSFLHAFLSRRARVSVDILFRLLSLNFFRRLTFSDLNDNIKQVMKLRFL